jgi:hypothetical protein
MFLENHKIITPSSFIYDDHSIPYKSYPISELKILIKKLAALIKQEKITTKQFQKLNNADACIKQSQLVKLRKEFRYIHIVYCELKGKQRHQIEKPAFYNQIDETFIENLKRQFHMEVANVI